MLLLEFPQFGIDVEGAAKIGLPLFVSILRKISQAVKQLFGLFQKVTKLTNDFPLIFGHDGRGCRQCWVWV